MKNKRLEFEENLPPEMIIGEILSCFKLNNGVDCPTNVFKALSKILMLNVAYALPQPIPPYMHNLLPRPVGAEEIENVVQAWIEQSLREAGGCAMVHML